MVENGIIALGDYTQGRHLAELIERLREIQNTSPRGPLVSSRTLLTSMLIAVEEALDAADVKDQSIQTLTTNAVFKDCLADIATYVLHVCALIDTPLDQLIEHRLQDREQAAQHIDADARAHA